MPYTKEQVIIRLQQITEQLGKTPTASYWNKHHIRPTLQPIRDLFGSWNKALEAAELAKNAVVNYTPESLIAKLRAVAEELGQTPTKTYWEEHHIKPTAPTYRKVFGSWNKALKIASLKLHRENLTVDKVLADIKAVAEKLGHSPMLIEYEKHGSYTAPPVYKRFKTWLGALDAAGLEPPNYNHNAYGAPATSEDVITSLRSLVEKLGKTPTATEYNEIKTTYCLSTLYTHFGTYDGALLATGLELPERGCGINIKCKDGHLVASLAEAKVDDFLFENDIVHAIQVRVCPERRWTCDFVVKDLWIEVDGLQDARVRLGKAGSFYEKLEYYSSHKTSYLVIDPYTQPEWKVTLLHKLS